MSNIKASTQEHLDIYTIKDHLVYLKDGAVALVLQTTAINFGLLSDEEQDATIYSYSALINSLSFPIQLLIRSQRKDVSEYIELLDDRIQQVQSQKIKETIIKYRQFIKSLVKDNRVLEKRFYVIVPFSTVELGLTTNAFNPFASSPQKPPFDLSYIGEKAMLALYPKRDHLIRQFARIGLKVRQLTTPELISLFYAAYNPEASTYAFQQAQATENQKKTIVQPKPEINLPKK
ncbi:hypothetical protein HYU91_00090 [Candidatus Collierbacteria bacterium]|nr:hypothetical protein [Candidatus Collierbacteria bacterium]